MKSDFSRKVTRDSLRSVSSHGDGTKMAMPSLGETGQLLDVQTFAEISVFQHLDLVNPIAFSLDGKKDALASDDEIMRLWDVQPLKNEKIENWLGEERKVWDRRQKGTKILLLGMYSLIHIQCCTYRIVVQGNLNQGRQVQIISFIYA